MAKVNLDAIVPREDFEITGTINSGNLKHAISITDFSSGFFYPFLRKPDFQRETNEWDSKKVCDFIESFIDGDLIPSIILWRSNSGLFFVIDGSHRLSALIAWINNDYGDGTLSLKFYDNNIPEEQIAIAQETRILINKRIGSYQELISASTNANALPALLQRARNLGAYSIQVQWVDGDAKKAESSFFKINQQGEPLNNTEIKLLQARKKPNCIAARAIIRAGRGHKYWSNFTAENQSRSQELANEINKILFTPTLQTPVKTLDVPIGGKLTSSQTLPLILDLVSIVNVLGPDFKEKLNDDATGDDTVKMLIKVRKIAWRINSVHPSSLGLHPVIYFYSQDGRHKPASFYTFVAFIMELESKNSFNDFIKYRREFEDVLIKYDYVVQQINRKYRSAISSYTHMKDFFLDILLKLKTEKNIDESVKEVISENKYKYLTLQSNSEEITTMDFSSERKSAIFIKEAVKNALTCSICGGFINKTAITFDHIIRKEDGGLGTIDNGQLAHPYCNSTFKN